MKKLSKKQRRKNAEIKAYNNLHYGYRLPGKVKTIVKGLLEIKPPKPKVKQRQRLKAKDYPKYIKSKAWLRRRLEYFKKFGRKCVICGETNIHVHHISYENLGDEKDEDLVVLCEYHHELFHEEVKSKRNMRRETNLFIIRQQQQIQFDQIMRERGLLN